MFDQPVPIANIPPVKIDQVPSQVLLIPYSIKHYQKMKQQSVEKGNLKRPYVWKALVTSCGKCEEDKSGGGHQQYFGNIYCPSKTAISYDAWKTELREKGYGKRKAKADKTAKGDLSSDDK